MSLETILGTIDKMYYGQAEWLGNTWQDMTGKSVKSLQKGLRAGSIGLLGASYAARYSIFSLAYGVNVFTHALHDQRVTSSLEKMHLREHNKRIAYLVAGVEMLMLPIAAVYARDYIGLHKREDLMGLIDCATWMVAVHVDQVANYLNCIDFPTPKKKESKVKEYLTSLFAKPALESHYASQV